jgi:tetratricopeptide (TPR) repeat protein
VPIAKEFLDKIQSLFEEKRVSVFCGAGISNATPSNLPLANALKVDIVGRLLGQERLKSLIQKLNQIPLEYIIEIVDRNSTTFLPAMGKVFHAPVPNRDHFFLAQLVTSGYLQTIMTTNFDTLIEKAISSLSGLSYAVYSSEDEFATLNLNSLSYPSIIKIHGTADNIESIRSTVQQIAIPAKSHTRSKAIASFFQLTNKSILILGYGARDEFDINPCLRSLAPTKGQERIYFIKHQANDICEFSPLEDPFSGFDGNTVACNTDQLIGALIQRLFPDVEPTQAAQTSNWQQFLNEWEAEIDVPTKLFLAAEVLEEIDELPSARHFYLESLDKWTDDLNRMKTLINLGNSEERMALFQEAEQHFKAAFDAAQKLGNELMKAVILQHLGQLAFQKRDYPASMILTKQSERIFERQSQEATKGIASVEHQLGMVLSAIGLHSRAEEKLKASLKLSIDLGDLQGQATTLAQLGVLYKGRKEFDQALRALNEARSMWVKLGKNELAKRVDGDISQVNREVAED